MIQSLHNINQRNKFFSYMVFFKAVKLGVNDKPYAEQEGEATYYTYNRISSPNDIDKARNDIKKAYNIMTRNKDNVDIRFTGIMDIGEVVSIVEKLECSIDKLYEERDISIYIKEVSNSVEEDETPNKVILDNMVYLLLDKQDNDQLLAVDKEEYDNGSDELKHYCFIDIPDINLKHHELFRESNHVRFGEAIKFREAFCLEANGSMNRATLNNKDVCEWIVNVEYALDRIKRQLGSAPYDD